MCTRPKSTKGMIGRIGSGNRQGSLTTKRPTRSTPPPRFVRTPRANVWFFRKCRARAKIGKAGRRNQERSLNMTPRRVTRNAHYYGLDGRSEGSGLGRRHDFAPRSWATIQRTDKWSVLRNANPAVGALAVLRWISNRQRVWFSEHIGTSARNARSRFRKNHPSTRIPTHTSADMSAMPIHQDKHLGDPQKLLASWPSSDQGRQGNIPISRKPIPGHHGAGTSQARMATRMGGSLPSQDRAGMPRVRFWYAGIAMHTLTALQAGGERGPLRKGRGN